MELFISLGGILCIYLGYRIFIIGTNQPFQVFADLTGWKLMAAIISPAILFHLGIFNNMFSSYNQYNINISE